MTSNVDGNGAWRRSLLPFLLGLAIAPSFVVLHEGGHFLAAVAFGFHPEFHYANVSYRLSRPPAPGTDLAITATGPAVQALLAAGGLLWLHRRRRGRRAEPASGIDWVATWLVFNAGRWLGGGLARPFTGTALRDEMTLSAAAGAPAWAVLSLLCLLSIGALAFAIRLHPPRSRLLPFAGAGAGGALAAILWLRIVGPWLLP